MITRSLTYDTSFIHKFSDENSLNIPGLSSPELIPENTMLTPYRYRLVMFESSNTYLHIIAQKSI